jgi:alkyl sulfatase BDS1-like metallo-beta-lactamase superfamily hydrolase
MDAGGDDGSNDLLARSDRILRGLMSVEESGLMVPVPGLCEVAERTAFLTGFSNVTAFDTDDGLVLVDASSLPYAGRILALLRKWSPEPVHTLVYSHGHLDHVHGASAFDGEAEADGRPRIRVVAHEAVSERFDRYRRSAGYNLAVNRRQFGDLPIEPWPTEYRYPDRTYRDTLELDIGGERFELHHAEGETDDHTWTWVPARGVLCPGDLFIWASPNAGNPQKVQRYPREWALALRRMSGLGAELLLPGHGLPVAGEVRIRDCLTATADLLDSLVDQTIALMNEGATLDRVLREVRPPGDLLALPYLRPIYDDPESVVRNVWRQYGGWYEGDPADLKPASDAELAAEIATLAGGPGRLASRALEVAADGDLRLAGHLAEMAALADPGSVEAHRARANVFEALAEGEPSLIASGIFRAAARESRARLI